MLLVVAALLQDVVGDGDVFIGVPKGQVGVRANGDGALLRVHAVKLGVVGGRQCDKAIEVDAALLHALGKQDRQAGCDARDAIGDPAEAFLALFIELAFRVVKAERAMIG